MSQSLVREWFDKWESGKYRELPVSPSFTHTSPFGKIEGKESYFKLVDQNRDKFLGQTFEILDGIYESDRACVRYIAKQGEYFSLEVSEWYYFKDNLIQDIVAYYHIGEVREERALEGIEG